MTYGVGSREGAGLGEGGMDADKYLDCIGWKLILSHNFLNEVVKKKH